MINALLVDDDIEFGQRCCEWLLKRNIEPVFCSDAESAELALHRQQFDIAIIDLMLPPTFRSEGLALLRIIRDQFKHIEPMMITKKNRGTVEIVDEAMRIGARFFLNKNSKIFFPKLEVSMEEILRNRRANVFLSHGHNELLKLKLKDFLNSKLGRMPIILAEQSSRGLTVVEKLERVSEMCCFAVVLMTKDDQQVDGGVRARQNVIHEIGFFQGKYGRKNVVLLAERGIELFTNISGIIRIEFEAEHFEECYEPLRNELDASTLGEL
jgi:CheY-like chemotaxis protein